MANAIAELVRRRAYDYAIAQGASPAEADAFSRSSVAIAWSESQFDPTAVGDQGNSVGLFQLHSAGRGSGMTVAARQDPETNIRVSMPELWQGFRAAGGASAFSQNPAGLVAEISRIAQRPNAQAHANAVRNGVFAQGLQYASTGEIPQGGGIISPVSGSQAANVSATVTPTVRVNRTPVQGGITSQFGTPYGMDSGKTYQGVAYDHFNSGVDFGQGIRGGEPVSAVVGGTVKLAADDGSGWGPRVVVVDAEGFEHSYGHLGQLSVQPGQTVESGQVIGTVGAGKVGRSSGPHLSYDVFRNGEPVDPSPWLGQNVVDPAIKHDPAKAQVPAYLSGATVGGAGVVSNGGSGSFFTSQIEDAKRQVAWAQQRQADIRAGRSGQDKRADDIELEHLDNRIAEEMLRLDGMQTALKNEQDLNPAAAGVSPLDQAAAISGIQQAQTAQNLDIFNAFLGILDKNFANQLGVSNLLRDIFNTNESNAQAAVASRQTQAGINLSGRNDIIQAQAMQQAAEIARASEALARAQWISDIDMRNVERMLPPGTHHVPGLAPEGDLMTAMRRLGLPGAGVRVTPVDWAQLDPRQALADADATLKPTPELDIAGLRQTAAANEQIAPYTPGMLTAEGVNLPQAPDLAALAPALGNVQSQAGGVTNEDLVDMVLGRGKYAPPLPQQQAAPITQTTGSSQPAMRDFPVVPGTTTTTVPRHDTTMRDFPVVLGTTTIKTDASTPPPDEEDEEDLLALLKKFGIGVAASTPIGGNAARAAVIAKRGWEFIR